MYFHYIASDKLSKTTDNIMVTFNRTYLLFFIVVFITGMQISGKIFRNYKQSVSVGRMLSAALVTNDIKIRLRAVGVASSKMH